MQTFTCDVHELYLENIVWKILYIEETDFQVFLGDTKVSSVKTFF